jgi:hypothetical protein
MAITLIDSNVVAATGSGSNVTASLSNITGLDVMIVVSGVTQGGGFHSISSVKWNGVTMSTAVSVDEWLDGPEAYAAIFYLAVGDVTNLSASAVLTLSTGSAFRAVTVQAWNRIRQTSPVRGVASRAEGFGGNSSTLTPTNFAADIVIDSFVMSRNASPTKNQAAQVVLGDVGASNPASRHVASWRPEGSLSKSIGWTFNDDNFCHAAASFIESEGPPPPPVPIFASSQSTDIPDMPTDLVRPGDTTATVAGADFDAGNITVYLADSPTFATATKELQSISAETSTSFSWVPSLGGLDSGLLWLFGVNDEGGDDLISIGLPVVVSHPDVRFKFVNHLTPTTDQTILIPFDDLKAVIIFNQGSTTQDATNNHNVMSYSVLDNSGGSVNYAGSVRNAFSSTYYREQVQGSLHVNVLSASSSGTSVAWANGTIDENGLTLTYGNTDGNAYPIGIALFGGKTMRSKAGVVQVSAGSVSGLGFKASFIDISHNGLTFGTSSDTVACLISQGQCDPGGSQHCVMASFGASASTTSRGSSTVFASGQINTSNTDWSAQITSINDDGFVWSGSNGDGMGYLGLYLDGAKTAHGQFLKETGGVNGTIESMPALGFDPTFMMLNSASRSSNNTSSSTPAGISLAMMDADESHCAMNFSLKSGSFESRQASSNVDVVLASYATSPPQLRGQISSFQDPVQIEWVLNVPFEIWHFYWAFEELIPPVPADDVFFSFAASI